MQKYCLERTICNIGCPERQLAEKLSGLSICKNLKIQFLVQLFDNGPMIQLWLDYCTSFLRFLTLGSLTGILPVDSWALFRYRSVKAGFEDSSWTSPDQVQNCFFPKKWLQDKKVYDCPKGDFRWTDPI